MQENEQAGVHSCMCLCGQLCYDCPDGFQFSIIKVPEIRTCAGDSSPLHLVPGVSVSCLTKFVSCANKEEKTLGQWEVHMLHWVVSNGGFRHALLLSVLAGI